MTIRACAAWLSAIALASACNDDPSPYFDGDEGVASLECRESPADCFGEIGGDCDVTDDCDDGVCCHDKNCGDGMCTYECDEDRECPELMRCEHHFCFFSCQEDGDCGPGQSCEHGHSICEYEGGH